MALYQRTPRAISWVAIGTFWMATSVAAGNEAIKGEWAARFRNDAPAKWKELTAALSRAESGYAVTSTLRRNTKIYRQVSEQGVAATNDKLEKYVVTNSEKETVWAVNQDYLFCISRPVAATEGVPKPPFVIEFLEFTNVPIGTVQSNVDQIRAAARNEVMAQIWLLGESIPDLVNSDRFVIKDVQPLERDGHTLVRVDFDWLPTKNENHDQKASSAYIVFDPEKHWSIREYQVGRTWGIVEGRLDYGDDINDLPSVKRKTELLRGFKASDPESTENITEIQYFTPRVIPAEEFRLSFYGLPEPAQSRGFHFFFWLNLAILSACIITLIVRARRRRLWADTVK